MSHSPTLKQLKYLKALAKYGHFGTAAEHCHITQSTLSAGISELEKLLGTTLIERQTKGLLITSIGEEVLARGIRILNETDDLVQFCEHAQAPFTQPMRLGIIPTIAPFILPSMLSKVRREHPKFKLYVRENLSAKLLEELYSGELDLLLLALPYPAEHVEMMHLFNDEFYLACSKDHGLAEDLEMSLDQLNQEDLLLLEDGHCLRDHAIEACKLDLANEAKEFQASSLNTLIEMVASNMGISLLPAMACDSNLLHTNDLTIKSFRETGVHREIALMWRKNNPRTQEYRELGKIAQELFG